MKLLVTRALKQIC